MKNASNDGNARNNISDENVCGEISGNISDQDYSDIIDLPRPKLSHPRMPREQRAAQFASFDALQGFGDEIEETAADHTSRFDTPNPLSE